MLRVTIGGKVQAVVEVVVVVVMAGVAEEGVLEVVEAEVLGVVAVAALMVREEVLVPVETAVVRVEAVAILVAQIQAARVMRELAVAAGTMAAQDTLEGQRSTLALTRTFKLFCVAGRTLYYACNMQALPKKDREHVRDIIITHVLKYRESETALQTPGNEAWWMFDFRKAFLDSSHLETLSRAFWDMFEEEFPFQVGGLETASIPFIAGILLEGKRRGKNTNGFFIRKSRKTLGLQKIIEGDVTEQKIILVDDLVRTGRTLRYQMRVLQAMNRKASAVFVFVSFQKNTGAYDFLEDTNTRIYNLFTLKDFDLENEQAERTVMPPETFAPAWIFRGKHASFAYETPKATPLVERDRIYFPTDNGSVFALDTATGNTIWEQHFYNKPLRRGIFAAPLLVRDHLYIAARGGNIYILDKNTGFILRKLPYAEAIQSSPAQNSRKKLIFFGVERGLFGKKGAVIALSTTDQARLVWECPLRYPVHTSIAYNESRDLLAVGEGDTFIHILSGSDGAPVHRIEMPRPVTNSLVFDKSGDRLFFGDDSGTLFIVDRSTWHVREIFRAEDEISSPPVILHEKIIFTSLDQSVYCVDLNEGALLWSHETRGRVFAAPVVCSNRVYVGSNDGMLYELDLSSGKMLGGFQTTERIMNPVICAGQNGQIFLTTYANELYCLKKLPE